jgi:hypothetical protein
MSKKTVEVTYSCGHKVTYSINEEWPEVCKKCKGGHVVGVKKDD